VRKINGLMIQSIKNIKILIQKELLNFRFSAKLVEVLCEKVRQFIVQIRSHERAIMDFCVSQAKMPRTQFIKSFPGNETSNKWLKEEMKTDKPYAENLEKIKHSILDQQVKLKD
jgi:RNA polymerase primary sigma factor